jgi:hypothetical protein
MENNGGSPIEARDGGLGTATHCGRDEKAYKVKKTLPLYSAVDMMDRTPAGC